MSINSSKALSLALQPSMVWEWIKLLLHLLPTGNINKRSIGFSLDCPVMVKDIGGPVPY
jgi:hypothetical protein